MVVEALGYRFSGRMLSHRSRSDAERRVPGGSPTGHIATDSAHRRRLHIPVRDALRRPDEQR